MSGSTALIFNVQRYSLSDGPGIRTTVFFKGCPLSCKWCSNPESVRPYPEVMLYDHRCITCGCCREVCPKEAITIVDGVRKLDWEKCNHCLACAEACPTHSIEKVGRYTSLEELMMTLRKDKLFYENSEGGVTFSGGEPLQQWEFLGAACRQCKEEGIRTALETSGYSPWEDLAGVLDYVDLVLYDVKHLDPQVHKEGTGVNNEVILENLARVASKARTWLRIPVIPGYNDSVSYVESQLAEYAARLKVENVSLLPYHTWGHQKYARLNRKYQLEGISPLSESDVRPLKEILESHGLKVTVGD